MEHEGAVECSSKTEEEREEILHQDRVAQGELIVFGSEFRESMRKATPIARVWHSG